VRDRIVAETQGGPLALLELPRGLTVTQMAGGFGLLRADALPGRIERRICPAAFVGDRDHLILRAFHLVAMDRCMVV
jgi:hypothetical protein